MFQRSQKKNPAMTLGAILEEEEERTITSENQQKPSFQSTLETVVDTIIGCTVFFSLYIASFMSLFQLAALAFIFASIRNPALIQALWPNCCPERKTIEQVIICVKTRLDDTRSQLDQETVAKHYKKASRRVKTAVRNAVVRIEDLKAQASVSLINSISKIDRKGTVAKYYEATWNSALSAGRLVRKRFDNQKYRVFLSLKYVLLQLDTNAKSKVGLVTFEKYVHKSISDKEALQSGPVFQGSLKAKLAFHFFASGFLQP